jgi:very-short-patch-repair endonuclease
MDEIAKTTARVLRKKSTPGEQIFWEQVRNRKLMGIKFLRQHPIEFEYYGCKRFIVADFYCHEARLIIELDGNSHIAKQKQDELRDLVCNTLDLRVIRFTEAEIKRDVKTVIQKLVKELSPLFL